MPGVIERIIENWLTSANERSYQIPFCQLLAAEGETIVYISPHGPFEQGKDVITLDKAGKPRAYQLKNGDINLAEWRKHKGELNDLVELPISHPGVTSTRQHIPYLVTNGEINDPALKAITAANQAWRKRKYQPLRTIAKGALLQRFLAINGTYLPHELPDFTVFLELILRDGHQPLDKPKLANLLESILPTTNTKNTPGGTKRALASAVLVTGYTLEQPYAADNHWAVFEAWILAGSYVLATAEKTHLPEKDWSGSFDLCEIGALDALAGLCRDCAHCEHLVEGDPWTDGHVYHARVTLLMGLLSAWSLYHRIRKTPHEQESFIREFMQQYLPSMKQWGESAVPHFVITALEMEAQGAQHAAETLVINTMRTILAVNGRTDGRPGLPSPYFAPEQALRLLYNLDQPVREDFVGTSYTIHPMIDFLARRWRRQALKTMWYTITGKSLKGFYPGEPWEWFRWRAQTGTLTSRFVGSPQSWAALLQEAQDLDLSVLPEHLRRRPGFAVLFALVFPHRFTRELLKLIEGALAS
jgi:hypothetical protein